MRSGRFAVALALVGAIAAARPAAARYDLVDGSEPGYVLSVARGLGAAELGLDGTGDPLIRGRTGGIDYRILFYGCTRGADCTNLTFTATWASDHYTDRSMGDWNRSRRFGTAYLDAGGNPTLEMSVNLNGGVTRASLKDSFDWWRTLLGEFTRYFGF